MKPCVQSLQEWRGMRLTYGEAFIRQLPPDLIFQGIQGADAFKCLERLRGALGRMYIEEFAARVGPASRLDQRFLHPIVQAVEPAIGIGLQDTAERLQMSSGSLALTIRRITKPHRRWIGTAGGSVIAHIGPKSSGAGLAGTGSQNADRGVVGVQLVGAQNVIAQGIDQRLDERTTGSAPVGECAALDLHAITSIDLALTVERQVIAILAHQDVG